MTTAHPFDPPPPPHPHQPALRFGPQTGDFFRQGGAAGRRRAPAQRLAVLIPYRVVLHEEPPVLAIVAPRALLELEGHATREGAAALLPQARHVFRMKHARAEICRGHLRDRETGVLEQRPVAVEGLPIRT